MSGILPPPEPIATASRARALLHPESRAAILDFLLSKLDPQGGFHDRSGHSDLYYTVFGLGSLLALGCALPTPDATRAFLKAARTGCPASFIDLVAWIRCNRCLAAGDPDTRVPQQALAAELARYRSADGGFSHEHGQRVRGTLYAAFLADQAYGDLGVCLPGACQLIRSIEPLQTPEGGYSNQAGMPAATTTATASAAVLFERYHAPGRAGAALDCLEGLGAPDGGYRASRETPVADLLSTATAVYARCVCHRPVDDALRRRTAAFVESLWHGNGGFQGHPADPVADVEYTFYGLLALGSMAERS